MTSKTPLQKVHDFLIDRELSINDNSIINERNKTMTSKTAWQKFQDFLIGSGIFH